jgi:hypothetical protein
MRIVDVRDVLGLGDSLDRMLHIVETDLDRDEVPA